MEKRAREREEKHAMIRERRIQMEEERIRLKQQASYHIYLNPTSNIVIVIRSLVTEVRIGMENVRYEIFGSLTCLLKKPFM